MRHSHFVLAVAASVLGSSASAQTLTAGPPADTFSISTWAATSPSLSLEIITDFRWLPDGRLVMIRKDGGVVVRRTDGVLVAAGAVPVDTASEKGLLGLEIHPSFAINRTIFLYYSRASSAGGSDTNRHRVVSITLTDANLLDMATEKIVLQGLQGPANHDGGALAVGPDGKLYVGTGDTGCNSSVAPGSTITNYFGSCLSNGNGKILRVNFDGTIPSDNPLVSVSKASACGTGATCATAQGVSPLTLPTTAPRADIWAWGFRNVWRMWFDPVTGKLWAGDVGEVTYEEIDIVERGRNHGWPFREGRHGYPRVKCRELQPDVGDCVDPVYECLHGSAAGGIDGDCRSITAGQIVDSCDWPDAFRGLYFFADNANYQLWTIQPNASRTGLVPGTRKSFGTVTGPVAIHVGPDGALYYASWLGYVYRVAPKVPRDCAADAGTDADVGDVGEVGASDIGVGDVGLDASTAADAGDGGTEADVEPAAETAGCSCQAGGAASRSQVAGVIFLLALGRWRRRPCRNQ